MNIEFSKEALADIYANCNAAGRQAIRNELGDQLSEILPVTTRVKTLDDAIAELGDDNPAVKAYRSIKYGYSISEKGPETADIIAYAALRVITEALNEGWKPQFTQGERQWYAWYDLISKEDLDEMSEEEKKNSRVVGRAVYNANAYGGLVYSNASHVSTVSYTYYGSRLAFKNEELAEYAAKQFIDIYADFCFIPATKENK